MDRESYPARCLTFYENKMNMDFVKRQEQAICKIIDAHSIAVFIQTFCIHNFKKRHECSKAFYEPRNSETKPGFPPFFFHLPLFPLSHRSI